MSQVAITIKNLTLEFGARQLVNIDFKEIYTGELVALIGRNGVGKSTLLKSLSGLQPVPQHHVFIGEKDLATFNPQELAQSLAFVFNNRQTPPALSVKTVVEMGRFAHGDLSSSKGKEAVDTALKSLNIEHLIHARIDLLSDGEFQKVAIARALAQETSILLLDEPTAFLDYIAREELIVHLKELAHKKNLAIVFTSHDIELVNRYADKIWELENKSLVVRK